MFYLEQLSIEIETGLDLKSGNEHKEELLTGVHGSAEVALLPRGFLLYCDR